MEQNYAGSVLDACFVLDDRKEEAEELLRADISSTTKPDGSEVRNTTKGETLDANEGYSNSYLEECRCWWLAKPVLEYYKCSEIVDFDSDNNHHNLTSHLQANLGQQCLSAAATTTTTGYHTIRRMKTRLDARMELLTERASMMMTMTTTTTTATCEGNSKYDTESSEAQTSRKMFETWTRANPCMRWFIFSDYVDPRARNSQLTTFDVTMRVMALHPFVSNVPKNLQKLSVARVLFSQFIHFDRNRALDWTSKHKQSGSTKKFIYAMMQSLIDNWKLVERGMRVAAAVIASFVGLETFHRKGVPTIGSNSILNEEDPPNQHNHQGKWRGFDCVFGKMEFAQAFIALRDPFAVLPPIIARVESNLNTKSIGEVQSKSSASPKVKWAELKVKTSAAHPQLLRRVCHGLRPEPVQTTTLSSHDHRPRVNENILLGHNRLFALLWHCYVRLKGNLDKTHQLLEDWFDNGIEKRLRKISERIERNGGYGIVNVKRILATENLVVLYLSGLHHYMPELVKEYFESNETPAESLESTSSSMDSVRNENKPIDESSQKNELDRAFLDHLFAYRIILDRPHLYRWDFHLDPAAITWAYHQMEP